MFRWYWIYRTNRQQETQVAAMPLPSVLPQQYYTNAPGQPGLYPGQPMFYPPGHHDPYTSVPGQMYGPGMVYPMQSYPVGYAPIPGAGTLEMTNIAPIAVNNTQEYGGDGKGTIASSPMMSIATAYPPPVYGHTHVPIINAYPVTSTAPIQQHGVSYATQ